ncbi:ABC transporter permease subunit [Gorillibacterium sp. sgz5001074]|uniref:ABC transporter permease subunit n=1 Tax=Gorillibacterium sp. sgz5001074 TaxID=3446695 RepID=UPI003F676B06
MAFHWPKIRYAAAWALLLLLAAAVLLGGVIKPYGLNPGTKIEFEKRIVQGEEKYVAPPFPPDAKHWLGTDHRGFDVLSLLLNGAKYTLGFALAVAVSRFALALPAGLAAGVSGRGRGALAALQAIFSAVPALLFVYPGLVGVYRSMQIDTGLPPGNPNLAWFAFFAYVLMTLAGVFPLAHQMAQRSSFYASKAYVSAARVMGAGSGRVIRRHILPHMREEILFAFLTELVQVLFLMGQLAVLGVYLFGGEILDYDPEPYTLLLTQTGEWCSILSYGAVMIRIYPWIVVSAGVAFTLSILILQFFLGELKRRGGNG